MVKLPLLKTVLFILVAVMLQSCSSGKNSASADINKFNLDIGEFTDSRDGKIYKTTKIGSQIWMAENLNYSINESMCYDDKTKNCDKYGRLYNWETAMKVCPAGWHLPNKDEWGILISEVDNANELKERKSWYSPKFVDQMIFLSLGIAGIFSGIIMRTADKSPASANSDKDIFANIFIPIGSLFTAFSIYSILSEPAVIDYGFLALPGGYVEPNTKKSAEIKIYGGWWSATEANFGNAYYSSMYYNVHEVVEKNYYKSLLLSVRCVLD